jgi:hypothetical protein
MRLALPVALSIAIVALHLPFVPPFAGSNRDGPMYINALKLDETYNVPATPGKIGFVLLAALALVFDANPVHAYAACRSSPGCSSICSRACTCRPGWRPRRRSP